MNIGVLRNSQGHIYLCRDQNNVPQAIVVFYEKPLKIWVENLATNPNNISSSTHHTKTKGAGTFLLGKAELLAQRTSGKIELESTGTVRDFYLKLGYTPTEDPYHFYKILRPMKEELSPILQGAFFINKRA